MRKHQEKKTVRAICWPLAYPCYNLEWTGHKKTNAHQSIILKYARTSGKEGTDHEAEVDGGHVEYQKEDKDQRGVTVTQDCSIRANL